MEPFENPDQAYALLSDQTAKWFVIFANQNFGYRVGPLHPHRVGEIMEECLERGCPASISVQTAEVDWEYALDLCGGAESLLAKKRDREANQARPESQNPEG